MAILSAAIGAYLFLAPPPDPIAHSFMEDGEGGNTHGDVAIEDAHYSPAQQLSLVRSNEGGGTDDSSAAETIRPSVEPTASSMDEEKRSKSGDAPVPEETMGKEKVPKEENSTAKTPKETTSNNTTNVGSKVKASKPSDK